MKIKEVFKNKMSFSFEVFPPKMEQSSEALLQTLKELYKFKPDFISCTYGAGGTNKGRSTEICEAIKKSGTEVMTHFTCIGNSKDDVLKYIKEYQDLGVENVLTMRGDLPKGWVGTNGDFDHADQLIEFIKENFPDMSMAAACYPETHIQAHSPKADIAHLRSKQDHGAEFLMTQLCYNIESYRRFMVKIRKAGISIPVIVGLMPVLSKDGLIRMTLSNGCSIPSDLAALIGKYGDNPEDFKKAGKEYTINMIYKYIEEGIDGLHIYSLNKYTDLAELINASGIRRNY